MSRIRNLDWQEDEELREDLQRYVLQNVQRKEVLDFVERDYPLYAWSLPTLSRRMSHFQIKYIDYTISPAEVKDIGQCKGRYEKSTTLRYLGVWFTT